MPADRLTRAEVERINDALTYEERLALIRDLRTAEARVRELEGALGDIIESRDRGAITTSDDYAFGAFVAARALLSQPIQEKV